MEIFIVNVDYEIRIGSTHSEVLASLDLGFTKKMYPNKKMSIYYVSRFSLRRFEFNGHERLREAKIGLSKFSDQAWLV